MPVRFGIPIQRGLNPDNLYYPREQTRHVVRRWEGGEDNRKLMGGFFQ